MQSAVWARRQGRGTAYARRACGLSGHADGRDGGEALTGPCAISRLRRGSRAADIRVGRSDVEPPIAEPAMSRLPFLASVLLLSVGVGQAHGQAPPATESATARARCAQLVEYWDRYNAGKGEGGGSMDMPRKSAISDCAARARPGRHARGSGRTRPQARSGLHSARCACDRSARRPPPRRRPEPCRRLESGPRRRRWRPGA